MNDNLREQIIHLLKGIPREQKKTIHQILEMIQMMSVDFFTDISSNQMIFALNDDYDNWLFSIEFKDGTVFILFHYGDLLDDRKNVFRDGAGSGEKFIEFSPGADFSPALVTDYVQQAIDKLDDYIKNKSAP